MTEDLILEIGSDEIPARYLLGAISDFKERAEKALSEARLEFTSISTYGTPRRLVLEVKGLAARSSDKTAKVRGPSKKVAFDQDGNPTKALLGFARSQGVDPKEVTIEMENGGEYVYAEKREMGRPAQEILADILPPTVMGIHCPYPLRWGDENWRWFRPIRWVLCLYGSEVVPLSIAGKVSGRISYGHRTLHPGIFSVDSAGDYFTKVATAGVMVDAEERRKVIVSEGQRLAGSVEGQVVFDEDLLDELVSLCECPAPFLGSFDSRYLSLPDEVLMTSMMHHQKYFPVKGNDGRLRPAFLAIRDGDPSYHIEQVREGNEWILKARLEDAEFFYNQDVKVPLKERLPALSGVRFLRNAGTVYEKSCRMERLAAFISGSLDFTDEEIKFAKEAALISKCDLVTSMVGEFPELEGIMGGKYAQVQGLPPQICAAVYQHYLPKSAKDALPQRGVPSAVALADKIDTLSMSFALGIEVTGSEDPFGLRRLAQGVVAIMTAYNYDLDIDAVLDVAFKLAQEQIGQPKPGSKDRLLSFLLSRVEVYLSELGFETPIVRATLGGKERRILRLVRLAAALKESVQRGTAKEVVTGWRRTSVLGQAASSRKVNVDLLVEDSERGLFRAIELAEPQALRMLEEGDFPGYLTLLASLREPIDRCLDEVLVMTKEAEIRENRLALLCRVADLFTRVADFQEILPMIP